MKTVAQRNALKVRSGESARREGQSARVIWTWSTADLYGIRDRIERDNRNDANHRARHWASSRAYAPVGIPEVPR